MQATIIFCVVLQCECSNPRCVIASADVLAHSFLAVGIDQASEKEKKTISLLQFCWQKLLHDASFVPAADLGSDRKYLSSPLPSHSIPVALY